MSATEHRARYRGALPQLRDTPFLTDGGIETTLIFHEGLDLPCFAAFDLLTRATGATEALRRYFEPYVASRASTASASCSRPPTWRANPDWAERLGHAPDRLDELNRRAVELLEELRTEYEADSTPIVISGCIGPRGDGYVVGDDDHRRRRRRRTIATQIATFAGDRRRPRHRAHDDVRGGGGRHRPRRPCRGGCRS